MRRYNQEPSETEVYTFRTDEPRVAFDRLAKRLGWPGVGLVEHFKGGSTYHIQFGRKVRGDSGTSLSDKYIVQVW